MRKLRQKIVHEQEHIMALAQMSADARIANFIIQMSKRFEDKGYSALEFNLKISRHDIANYLGLAPETLSRRLSILQDMGYFSTRRNNVVIVNMDGLYELSGRSRFSGNPT
jgi:CRP/FNR family transcriptional regulator